MHAEINHLFRTQHGLAADRQLRSLGVSWEEQRTQLRRGTWCRFSPAVIALAGSAASWKQRAMAASLGTSGLVLLDGAAAARLHGLDGYERHEGIAVIAPHDRSVPCNDDVVVTHSRRLSARDRHVVDAVAVTTLPVTLVRLAALGFDPSQALDSALRRGASPVWLRQHFERWRGPGVSGPTTCIQLLAERVGHRLPRSWFQRLAQRALHELGITTVEEWPVRDEQGSLVAELDLAIVECRVGVECQSIEYHASAADVARDIRRKRRLRRLGWDIVELWWTDLDRMDDVIADLRAAVVRATR